MLLVEIHSIVVELSIRHDPSGDGGIKRGIFGSRREEVIEDLYNQVKELESKYKKLYEGSPEMYRTINIHGFIIDCNQAYVDSLQYVSKNEVIGHSIFEHTAPENMDSMHASFREWQLKGTVRGKHIRLRRKDGSTFPALVNASSLFDDNGKLVGSNTVITDMTEIQKTRQELQDAYEQLKEAQKLKEDFIRIAAHDLRSPIQPILVMAELATSNPAHLQEALRIIVREAKRLKKLADDLLDLAKIENGSLSYEMKQVKANHILEDIVEFGRLCLRGEVAPGSKSDSSLSNRVEIVPDFDHSNVQLLVDKDRVIQALSNIIGNSIKYTKEGRITVRSRILEDKGVLAIEVIDTGPGIPKEILTTLFERFTSKRPEAASGVHQGTGLGLFIARSIIRAHSGDVTAFNNQSERGATFMVTLPIDKRSGLD
jgi:PAS domain S-box-containing protein